MPKYLVTFTQTGSFEIDTDDFESLAENDINTSDMAAVKEFLHDEGGELDEEIMDNVENTEVTFKRA
jgi:hypothetical protein